MLALAVVVAAAPASTAGGPLRFEKPVVVKQGAPKQHAWFPEGGAVVGGGSSPARGSSAGSAAQAVITAVRFNGDGGPPLPGHTDEALVSWDGGKT